MFRDPSTWFARVPDKSSNFGAEEYILISDDTLPIVLQDIILVENRAVTNLKDHETKHLNITIVNGLDFQPKFLLHKLYTFHPCYFIK